MIKRMMLHIQPGFQKRLMLFWMLQAFAITFFTCLVTIGWAFFYTNPTLASYTRIIVRPALYISAAVAFMVSALAGLFYSLRIAGPVYHIKHAVDRVLEGGEPELILLRRHDELKDLATSVNKLIERVPRQPKNEEAPVEVFFDPLRKE
ncbi:MAG TPA: hypothetical protein DCS63_04330 [Elusimicrobia bacterium]|nr:hypothetical protein [Elusimicrobiota bacterium]